MKDQENSRDIEPNLDRENSPDSSSVSACCDDNKIVSREEIETVQHLIERCLQLYMDKDEVQKTLLNGARIEPEFTTLVWQKLEEENADFFRAYYIRLKLKKQITIFNQLLEHQYHLMKHPMPWNAPLAPMPNGNYPMPVNNLPMGFPVIQHSPLHPHIVNGVSAPPNFHPMWMDSGNDIVIDTNTDASPILPPDNAMSSMSDVPVSPTSVASCGHFSFSSSEISGDVTLDTAFTRDLSSSVGLQLSPDNGVGNSGDSLGQIPWNFSLSDLTSLGDLGALGNYPGSPSLPSDSDILLDSLEQDTVDEFFLDSDSIPGQSQSSDEGKP